MKRQPTLYDLFAASANRQALDVPEFDRAALRDAARFVFDDDASRFVAKLLTNVAPLVLREHEFARPPHPITWIEFSFAAFAAALPDGVVRDWTTAMMPDGVGGRPREEDRLLGFLITGRRVYVITDTVHERPTVMPYWFEFHDPIGYDQEMQRASDLYLSRLSYRQILLGAGFEREWYSSQTALEISRTVSLCVAPSLIERFRQEKDFETIFPRIVSGLISSQIGTLKYYFALVLMLTRPGRGAIHFSDVPRARSIYRGKSVTLAPHHKLTLHLAEKVALHKVVDALHSTGIHHRHHSVRGHWAQTRRGVNHCAHEWEAISPTRYACLSCEAKRWWRKDHYRGDESLGEVTKDYEVHL